MIELLDLKSFRKGLKPVLSTEFFSKPGEFHPEGLFSEIIFGPLESLDRRKTFSYIHLYTEVIHPTAYMLLTRLDKKIELFVSAQEKFSVDKNGTLIIDPNGVTGIKELKKLFPKIVFRGGSSESNRDKFIEKIEKSYKNETLFLDIIPIIPPYFRDTYQDSKGMWIWDPLNDYYISIMRKALQIRSITKTGPLFDLLNFEIQRSVIEHDNFIRKKIQKKQGLIRSSLLGKRTDFSGRAVVTPGPTLKVNEIGIPLRLAVSLFEPFIIYVIFNSGKIDLEKLGEEIKKFTKLDLSIDSIKIVFKAIKSADIVPKDLYKIIFDATYLAMQGRVVLAKRDPVLHAESVRGFKAVLVTGNTVQICTLQVKGFNADFDGDAMAVFHPVTDEAQEEVKTKFMRSESGENSSSVNFLLSKEMGVGLYILTKNITKNIPAVSVGRNDLERATDPYIPVVYKGKKTTMGKAIFNNAFPTGFPFYDGVVTLDIVNKLIPNILEKYGQSVAIDTFSKLKDIAFKFATIGAPNFSLDDIKLPDSILKLKEKLKTATIEEADSILKQIQKELVIYLKDTGLYDIVESGSAKGWGQPMQILVAKGLISDPQGNILDPIASSFSDGLSNKDYFHAAAGSRTGIIDRVLNTADSGYMSRQLAYVLNSVEIDRTLKDCKTNRCINLRLTSSLMGRLNGRYVLDDKNKLDLFKSTDYKAGDVIKLRTPIYCESPKICHTCYGKLLERHRTPYAGILAAQVIGEAGTQTILRTFHTGGAVKLVTKDIINDLVQNDPLITKQIITKYLTSIDNSLVCLQDCILTLNLEDYPLRNDLVINENETGIYVRGLVGSIEFSDKMFNLILDYPVELSINEMEKVKKEYIKLFYKKDDKILETFLEAAITTQQLLYARRLLGGREIYKDPDHLLNKLFKIYDPLTKSDLVHLEILLSQCLRDRKNPSIPARLGKPWDPIMINIKQIVFKTSFIQGLAFENINEAIRTGLVTKEVGDPSILEQILTGELVRK